MNPNRKGPDVLGTFEQPAYRLGGRPIPTLTSIIQAYEKLVREIETQKIELEHLAKEEKILKEELNYIKSIMKELGPSYSQMEQMIGQLSGQSEDECFQLKRTIKVMEQHIASYQEQARVAIDTERQKAANAVMEQREHFAQKLEDCHTVAIFEKKELEAKIKAKRDYINRKLQDMKREHENKKEDIRKKHINRLKMKDHLDCQTRQSDLSREIKDLEKEYERLKKTSKILPANPPRASSTPKNKLNKLCFYNDASFDTANAPVTQPNHPSHPALSALSSKPKEDNHRKRKLFSVNAHFTDF